MLSIRRIVDRRFSRRALRAALVTGAAISASGCQQQELFPGMVAPTTAQSNAMGWPAPRYFGVEEGDNQDPMVDTPNYPYGGTDWYAQPGYLQG